MPPDPIKRLQRLATPDNGYIIQAVCNLQNWITHFGRLIDQMECDDTAARALHAECGAEVEGFMSTSETTKDG